MKYIIIFLISIFVTLILVSCVTDNAELVPANLEEKITIRLYKEGVLGKGLETTLIGDLLIIDEINELLLTEYVEGRTGLEFEGVSSLHIDRTIGGNAYQNLVFYMQYEKSERSMPYAFIIPEITGILKAGEEGSIIEFTPSAEHSCEGAPCSCCSFTRSQITGAITGCNCNGDINDANCHYDDRQRCNHTVSGKG